MKPAKQTSKEQSAEREAQRIAERIGRARLGLIRLRQTIESISSLPKMKPMISAIHEHMSWLIREDEVYTSAAAMLFTEQGADNSATIEAVIDANYNSRRSLDD